MQTDVVVKRVVSPLSLWAEVAAASLPEPALTPELFRQPLLECLEKVEGWFSTLPPGKAHSADLSQILWMDRGGANLVRAVNAPSPSKEPTDCKVIYFNSSPEIWLVRIADQEYNNPNYVIASWRMNRVISVFGLDSDGTVSSNTPDVGGSKEREALSALSTIESHLTDLEIERKITGEPRFSDPKLNQLLSENRSELPYQVVTMIGRLPRNVFRSHFYGDTEVSLGGIQPNNRRDLQFYDPGGVLQLSAVREAVPELMRAHDILKAHGFNPWIEESKLRRESTIPMLSLKVATDEAMKLVEM